MSDDGFSKMRETMGGTCGMVTFCITVTGCLTAIVTLISYFGMYAFSNPDVDGCFYIEGLEHGEPTKAGALAAAQTLQIEGVDETDVVNAHALFVNWFAWAFWTAIIPCMVLPLCVLTICLNW